MTNHRLSFSRFFALLVAFLLIGQTSVLAQQSVTPKPPASAADRRLETIEELSESLANDILTLSVAARDRDAETTERHRVILDHMLLATMPRWAVTFPNGSHRCEGTASKRPGQTARALVVAGRAGQAD